MNHEILIETEVDGAEEYADLLLAMEASFPRCEGNKMFYNNLERVYKEKAKRWAERLKDHDN